MKKVSVYDNNIPFEIIPIDEYLFDCIIASPFFYFDYINEYFDVRIDHLDYGNFLFVEIRQIFK